MVKDRDQQPVQGAGEDLKPYEKPTLTKGQVLSKITASEGVSLIFDGAAASDIRLKRDIHPVGRAKNGLTLYRFCYLWSDVEMVGVMAQEVLKVAPEAVIMAADGFYRVDYARLGLRFMTYAEWRGEAPVAAAA